MCNRILYQFYKGFRMMREVSPCITVFGSARIGKDHEYYKKVYEVGKAISELKYVTLTGGGGGLMQAANQGAYENGGLSIGCNIVLPREQMPNAYMHKCFTFNYFFIRKFMLTNFSVAYVITPGGFGTADEYFNVATLIQTNTIDRRPIILMDSSYHEELRGYIQKQLKEKMISPSDLEFIYYADTAEDLKSIIKKTVKIDKTTHKLRLRNRII